MHLRLRAAFFCLLLSWVVPVDVRADAPADTSQVGRVRITQLSQPQTEALARVEGALRAAMALDPLGPFAQTRLVSVRTRPGEPARFDATIFDYDAQKAFDLVVDAEGRELSRTPLNLQPSATPGEIEDAKAIVSRDPIWAKALGDGARTLYEVMPTVTVDDAGRRLVNVGVMAASEGSRLLLANEVVSVDLPRGRAVRYTTGAPPNSSASLLTCNPPPESFCSTQVASCDFYHVEWPAASPVWKFNMRHPSCTTSVQSDGTGLELTDVFYKNELLLRRMEIPVVNVKYNPGAGCSTFRDILFSEDCFKATDGVDVSPGIRVTTGGTAPSTICESNPPSDGGTFRGVAIHDQGDALWMITELEVGWYRYVMEYRLHLDGTIEPIFGFSAIANGCTCEPHTHHAYWRFDWAIGGASGDPATGVDTLERLNPTIPGQFDPVSVEGRFTRPRFNGEKDLWRVRSLQTGTEYIIKPGTSDGSAQNDAYAKGDYWALTSKPFGEIDDPNLFSDTSIAVDVWVNGEAIGSFQPLALWYAVGFGHNAQVQDEVCHILGPQLMPVPNCMGDLSFSKKAFGCGEGVALKMDDLDLAGAGSVTVTLASTSETSPENVVLTESAAKPGRFTGIFPSITAPAVHGDGKISVTPGDTLTGRYVDASSCGAPNVAVVRTASVDCAAPALSNVSVSDISTSAVVTWTTNEPATSVLHYGPSAPGSTTVSEPSLVTSHRLDLTGLAACSPYAYDLQSTDLAGNTGASPAGGGSLSFTSGNLRTYTTADGVLEIPNYDQTGVTSTVFIPENKVLQDVEVEVDITHTADYNLLITLTSPDGGTTVTLSQYRGGIGHDFTHTLFDDEATNPISTGVAPFTGSYRPDSPLSAFDGKNAHGTWTLKIVDIDFQGLGTLDSWSMKLGETCPPPSIPPPVPDGAFGSAMQASRGNPAGSTIQLVWDAASCPAPGYHVLYGPLPGVASYALSGAKCALGVSGAAAWTGVPAGDLWFVIAAENETGMEGSWGRASSGAIVGGSVPSGLCGATSRLNTATCP